MRQILIDGKNLSINADLISNTMYVYKKNNFKKLTKLYQNISQAYIYGKSAKLISNQIKLKISVKLF